MKYNFDKPTNRKNTGSYKWDVKDNELPLWVADMDFETAPCIKKALKKRVNHGIFGYNILPSKWAQSYIYWWEKRHHLKMQKDELIFATGVVPLLSSSVRNLSSPGDKVLIQTPVYNIFFNSIVNNGRTVLESPLAYDSNSGKYSINFEQLEKDLSDPLVTLMFLCNPHNPCGIIWTKAELSKIGALCQKHGVTVISDEIHCDITKPGLDYIPFASVNETCKNISVSCIAPTKCFNIAGLNTACAYVPNPDLRFKVWRQINTDECGEPNSFAVDAAVAAFTKGEDWLNQLNEYLWQNREFATEFIQREIPVLKCIQAEATYLLWADISRTGLDGINFAESLRKMTGLYICDGNEYGKTGENFVRINLACQKSVLQDAMNRLKDFCLSL